MENQTNYINLNGLTNDTIDQILKFQKGIDNLNKNVSMDIIFEYIELNKKRDDVPAEIYEQLDGLKECEKKAILNELPVIQRQAARNGIKLPDIIEKVKTTGQLPKVPIMASFSPKTLEKIPNLKVMMPFIWIPQHYLETFKNSANTGLESKNDSGTTQSDTEEGR